MSNVAKVALAALGVGGAVTAGVVLEQKAKAAVSQAPGAGQLALQAASGPATVKIGAPLAATLTFTAQGGSAPAQTAMVGVTLTQGGIHIDTTATARVPAIAAGATARVTVTTAGPVYGLANGTVGAVFALASGSTASFTFQVQANPAAFAFVAGSAHATNSPVPVGQYATATVQVKNTGGTAGIPSVAGVVTLGGVTEGHWQQTTSPTIQPGQTAAVNLKTSGTIASQFAGDTLTGTLALG